MSTAKLRKSYVKFGPKGEPNFYDTVKAEVAEYFASRNLSQHANATMYIKTAAMLSFYFVPLIVIISGVVTNLLVFYALWMVTGVGIVGIGASVMHDANHGAYTTSKKVNAALGNLLNVIGGYSINWRIQHNILHHTYTNLVGLDEDIDAGIMIRMSPHKPYRKFHRFQHIYCWFLYTLMNIFWVAAKDYRQLYRYEQFDLLKKEKTTLRKSVIELSLLKVFYFSYILVLPMLFSGFSWQQVLGGFLLAQMVAGLSLALIFQPAHVIETCEFPATTPDNKMENSWAVHQLINTANFCPNSNVTSWFVGGLNYQIEHHLFPQICHVHYPEVSKIVKRVAGDFNLPYQVMPTFMHAIYEHGKMLKKLGRSEVLQEDMPDGAVTWLFNRIFGRSTTVSYARAGVLQQGKGE